MSAAPQQVEWNGAKHNLKECTTCKDKLSKPGQMIFFIKLGEDPATKKINWELHNPDGSLHEHPKRGGGGGYSSPPPPAISDVVIVPMLLANAEGAAKHNQELITGLQTSGFEIAVRKDTFCPDVQFDPISGAPLLIMFKRK